jgi:glycosyltransferase involved in cell wall biosynthesis
MSTPAPSPATQALNEERCIVSTMQQLKQLKPPPLEIIVVDGGSTDR